MTFLAGRPPVSWLEVLCIPMRTCQGRAEWGCCRASSSSPPCLSISAPLGRRSLVLRSTVDSSEFSVCDCVRFKRRYGGGVRVRGRVMLCMPFPTCPLRHRMCDFIVSSRVTCS